MSEGVLDERGEHEDVADPEVDVQRLDGRGPRQRGAGADHQCGHGEDSGDAWGTSTDTEREHIRTVWLFVCVWWGGIHATGTAVWVETPQEMAPAAGQSGAPLCQST